MVSIIKFFINWLSTSKIVTKHSVKVKILLMVYPFFLIQYYNHFVSAVAGESIYFLVSSVIIVKFEQETGLNKLIASTTDKTLLHRLDAMKIFVLFIFSIVTIFAFVNISPLTILYPTGNPNN